MGIEKEAKALNAILHLALMRDEVCALRNRVLNRVGYDKELCFVFAGELLANAVTIVSLHDGNAEAVKLLREFADNIENKLIKKSE